MTDADDKLSRRYRDGARDEPPAHLDAAILAASRRAVGAGPRARKSNWMVPTSIAAVLVLGIGVSLRMQMEKPGIETSTPGGSAEYPVPSAEPPPPPPARQEALPDRGRDATMESHDSPRKARKPDAARQQVPAVVPAEEGKREVPKALAKEEAQRAAAPTAKLSAADALRKDEPNPFAEAPIAMQPAVPASPPAVALSVPAVTPAPPAPAAPPAAAGAAGPTGAQSTPAPQPKAFAQAEQATPVPQAAPAPAMRAKREALANDTAAARESRAIAAVADPDPVRELERIARLREAGRHPEADRALEEFRRRHADFRIPDATWERVKPR